MPPAAPAFKLKVKGNKPFRPFSTLEDEDALVRTWRATSKVCADLEDGQRLENLSWRLWGMHSSDLQESASSKLKSKSKESPLVLHSRRVGEKLNSEKSLPIEQLSPILIPHATSFKIRSRKTESSNIAGPSQIKKKKLWITTLNQDVRMEIDGGNGNDDIDEDMIDYERYSRGQSLSTNPSRASSPGRFEGEEELPHPDCAGANGLPGPCKVPGCTAFGQPEPTLSNGALGLDTSAPSSPPLLQKISSDSLKNKSNQSQNSPSSSKKKIEDILQEGSNSSSSPGQTPIPFDELLRQFVASNGGNVSAEDPLGLGSDAFDGDDCPFAAAAVAMSNSPQGEGDGNGDGGNVSSSRNILQLPLCCRQRANASPGNGDTTPTHRCCADEKVKELQGQNSPSRATTASEQLTTDLAKMLRSTNGGTEASSHQQSLNLTSHPNNEATANFGFGFDPRQQLAQWLSQQQRSGSGNAIGGLGSGMPLWPTTAHLMQGQSPMNASTPALNSPGPLSVPGTPLSATSYYQPLPPGCAFASNSSTSMGPPSEPITPSSAGPSSTYSSSNNKGKRRADPFVPVCSQCGTSSTPLWRRDAKRRVVCNKCGLRSAKKANASGSNGTGADGEKGSTNGEDGDGNADEEKEDPPICNNCGTGITSLWRKDEDGLRSCNPCGLWLKHHGFPRPVTKRTDVVRRRMRHYDEPQSPSTRAEDTNNNENAHTHSNRSSISVPQDQQGQAPCAISTLSQPPPYPSNQSTMMSQQGSSQGHPMNPNQPVNSSAWAPPPYPQPQGGPGFIRDPAQAAAGAYVYFQATGTWPPGWAQQMQQFQQFQPQQNNQFQQNNQLPQGWNQPSLPPHLQLQAQTMPPPASPGFQQQQSPGSQQSWPYQNDTLSQSIGSMNQNHQQTMHNQNSSTSTYNSPNAPAQASQFYSNSASNSPATFHDSPIASPAASISNSVDGGDKKPKSKASKLSGNNIAKSAGVTGRPQRGRPPGGVGIANSKRKRNVAGGETAENGGNDQEGKTE